MAVADYHDTHHHFPPPYVNGPDGKSWHSWRILILPYIEQKELYDAYNFDEPWDGPNNRKLAERMPQIFRFHGSEREGNTTTNYLAVVGEETIWPGDRKLSYSDITDGTSETILIVENHGAGIHWMEPRDLRLDEIDLHLNSPGGVSSPFDNPGVAMADGSARSFHAGLTPETLRALFTIQGNEQFTTDAQGDIKLLNDGRLRPRVRE